uniref:Uncharacterized protein n=1 Tax=Panagrolaimus sp. PS1159 TaxID=55785 RepID=A0AC35F5Y6_9BILA
MFVQSFPLDPINDTTNPEDTVYLIPRHTKRSIYGLYRYLPKMDENKIKKDYDDSFEGGYARYYFTE